MNVQTTSSLIHQIANFEVQFVNHHLRDLNLNSDQGRTMTYIAHHPHSKQRDIAHYLNRQEASITNLLKGLVNRNLVIRTVPLNNERTKLLSLTPEGEQALVRIEHVFHELNQLLQTPLNSDNAGDLNDLLHQVKTHIYEEEANPSGIY